MGFLSNFFRSSSSNNASLAQQPSHPRPDFHPRTATGRRTSTAAPPPPHVHRASPTHLHRASPAPPRPVIAATPSHRSPAQLPQPRPASAASPSQRRSAQLPPCQPPPSTLIVWGDQDQIFPLELGYRLQRHIGEEADLVVIKNAGHAVNLEKTNEFAKHLKAFLYESLSD
nr:monoacylglycerol lipase ABHD6 [Ipomoea batatas]